MTDDRENDPGYQEYLAGCARECKCCEECSPGICGSVLQGNFCDRMCVCSNEPDDEELTPDEQEARERIEAEEKRQAAYEAWCDQKLSEWKDEGRRR